MIKTSLTEELEILRLTSRKRSKAARLKDIFDNIEITIASGISYQEIIDLLAKHELVFTINTFTTTLSRIRKKRILPTTDKKLTSRPPSPSTEKTPSENPPVLAPKETTTDKPTLIEPKKTEYQYDAHDPRRIDEILRKQPDLNELRRIAKANRNQK